MDTTTTLIPIGANAVIRWRDEDEPQHRYISFGDQMLDEDGDPIADSFGIPDEEIFFYADPHDEEQLMEWSDEDWILISWDIVYQSRNDTEDTK